MAYARDCASVTGPRPRAGSVRCGIVQKIVLASSSFGGGYSLKFRLYLLYLLHLVLKSSISSWLQGTCLDGLAYVDG